jgi:signal transduction histidine kinase/DNA-binding response OmpR family regulator
MPRVLVVDDDPHVARSLRDLLAVRGFPASSAGSGEEALELLGREPFDLVILDVRLPGMTGIEACARIRERWGLSLPVVILTAYGDADAVQQGYDAGADDFIEKPVDTPSLILKARALARQKALHDEIERSRRHAEAQARDLAVLHEIGRDWSLIAEPEDFTRTLTTRLAGLLGVPICGIGLFDPDRGAIVPALPVFGARSEAIRDLVIPIRPEYQTLWDFRSGRSFVGNSPTVDAPFLQELMERVTVESALLVPLVSGGTALGMVVALNKPGGFRDSDAQLVSVFAGPTATFLRSRELFQKQRRRAGRLESLASWMAKMAGLVSRAELLDAALTWCRKDLGCERARFYALADDGGLRVERDVGGERSTDRPIDADSLRWVAGAAGPLQTAREDGSFEMAVPIAAGGGGSKPLGVLGALRAAGGAFDEEEMSLASAVAGHLAVALQKAAGAARTEALARQMGALYDLGLETAAILDLRQLFARAAEEGGRLIDAEFTSVLRLDDAEGVLSLFAVWARHPERGAVSDASFRLGEGIAGRVARDGVPAIVNDVESHPDFVQRGVRIARLLCVPLSYFDQERDGPVVFGVMNATRRPGGPPFAESDLDCLGRFARQLSIGAANSVAFVAERERSEQLALVHVLLREIAASLSPDRVLQTAVARIQEAFRYSGVVATVAEGSAFRVAAAAASSAAPGSAATSPPSAEAVAGRAFREAQTVVVQDTWDEPFAARFLPETRSQLSVPVRSGSAVRAVITVEKPVRRGFRRGEILTLETLAEGIGTSLRNAELYEALERTNAQLVDLDRAKSELVHIVAHDFRAPLAAILGHAELAEARPDRASEDWADSLRSIAESARHMSALVDKTLETSRLETGSFPFEFAVVDLRGVVASVLDRVSRDERHPILVDLPEDPIPLWADRDRLAEVLDNLVSNAVKYSPGGGDVAVQVRRDAEAVVVAVSDHGIGISGPDVERLFKPFSRLRNPSEGGVKGSGLGLYICERIVRAHGGRLWVESRPGDGSVFRFSLPTFGAEAQTGRALLLVGSGDDGTRQQVRRLAEGLGFRVEGFADGLEVVEAGIRHVPAAVVLDRVLFRLGGAQVAERLREHRSTASVPLFALASPADLGSLSAHFSAFLPKPLDEESLLAALVALRDANRLA